MSASTPAASLDAAPIGRDVAAGLAHWVARQGDAEAVTFGDRRYSWIELQDRVARFAGGLLAEGLGDGGRFAHIDRNHVASLEATLAAAAAGSVHVTLNWRLASEELAYMLDHSEAEVVFVGEEFRAIVEDLHARGVGKIRRVIVVGGSGDEYEPWLAAHDPAPRRSGVDPDEVILQMYTSGTTGRPKGAMLSHRSLGVNATGQAASVDLEPESVHLIAMPLFHVGGQAMVMMNQRAGARTVISADPSPSSLLGSIEGERVTHLFLVPTAFDTLISDPAARDHDLSSLESLMYSGAPMPLPVLERSLEVFPGALAVHGGYGMTEISGMASSLAPAEHRNAEHPDRLRSVGQIMRGLQWRIVGLDTGEDVAIGDVGELWLRHPSVIPGYWKDPDATAAAIVDGGWLRTGDLVRSDDDGFIYIVGRAKDMIISGGENIYPAEVERVLHAIPGVVEAAAIGVPDERFGEAVRAYVVLAPDASLAEDDIIAACRDQLARFKCPKSVRFVDALPRNTTGKILKHVLRAEASEGSAA